MVDAQNEKSLRIALERLVAELDVSLAESAEAAKPVELDQASMGRVSRIDAIQQQKMLEANRQAQQQQKQLAQAALRRIGDDEYGECLACGEEISLERLRARPESLYCIDCQSKRERR